LSQAKSIMKQSVNEINKSAVNKGIELLDPKQEANTIEKPKARTAQTQMQSTAS
jgi:hypothetical protein